MKAMTLESCSRKCLRTRPPYIARIEREYSSDILTIFHTVFNKFKNLSSVESVLNISRNKIEFILNNYVRGLLSKFMSLIDNNELFSIINRNNPKCENILEKMDKNKFQFGQPTKSIKNLYLELCEIF